MKYKNSSWILILIVFICVFNQEAHAYINPGTGSYLFQTVISSILGVFYLFKKLGKNILSAIKGKKYNNE